jgi:hypothetical protein
LDNRCGSLGYGKIGICIGTPQVQGRSSSRKCDKLAWSMVAGTRLAMDVHHGWFSDNKEWIEYIAAVAVLSLLAMAAVSVFDLRSVG